MLESAIEKKFRLWVESQGGECLKLRPVVKAKGYPDRTVMLLGHTIKVEMKQASGTVSPHQRRWIKRFGELGIPCVAAFSFEEARDFVVDVVLG